MAGDRSPAPGPRSHRTLRWTATGAALVVAAGFGGLIVALPEPPVLLHEVAGLLLLGLVGIADLAAYADRAQEPRPLPRLILATGVLIGMGLVGGALALGLLPASWNALPLAFLLGFGLLLADSLRAGPHAPYAPEPPRQARSGTGRSAGPPVP
jgi:hypothetical protein